jgi:hypothetical protein
MDGDLQKYHLMLHDILYQVVMENIYENFIDFSLLCVTSHRSIFVLGRGYDFTCVFHGSIVYTFMAMNRVMFVS